MALSIIQGKPGQGKSYVAVCLYILPALARGQYVATNIEMRPEKIEAIFRERFGKVFDPSRLQVLDNREVPRLFEVVPGGQDPKDPVLIVIDEAHKYFNARDFAKNDANHRDTFVKLTEHRHYHFDCIFLSQSVKNIDAQIVRLHNGITSLKNLREWHVPKIPWLRIPYYDFLAVRRDGDGKTIMRKDWLRFDAGLADCYNTHSVGSRDALASGSVGKVNLTIDPVAAARLAKAKQIAKVVSILFLMGVAFALARWTAPRVPAVAGPKYSPPVSRSAPVVVRDVPPPYVQEPAAVREVSVAQTAASWIAAAPSIPTIMVAGACKVDGKWRIGVTMDGSLQQFEAGGWTTRGRIGSIVCLTPARLWQVHLHEDSGATTVLRLALQSVGMATGPLPAAAAAFPDLPDPDSLSQTQPQ